MEKQFEIPYSKELVEFLKFLNKNKIKDPFLVWWAIHNDEHSTGLRHIGVRIEE